MRTQWQISSSETVRFQKNDNTMVMIFYVSNCKRSSELSYVLKDWWASSEKFKNEDTLYFSTFFVCQSHVCHGSLGHSGKL